MNIPSTKVEINAILKEHIVKVKFRKANGTIRNMQATLVPKVINEVSAGFTGHSVSVPDHQIRCVDVEIGQWRSFNIDTILEFVVTE